LCAWLTRVPVVTYLVAYSSHYEGKLRLPWPCGYCLSSSRFYQVLSRDRLTAQDLTNQLKRPVHFLGNPFMDPVLAEQSLLPKTSYRLGLLPGSRRPELDTNLSLLLRVIQLLPDISSFDQVINIDLALVNDLDDDSLQTLARSEGWQFNQTSNQLIKDQYIINVYRGCFAKILKSSDLLLAMAGTAAEQAIGLGKPVLQLKGFGPQFTDSFAEAQRRLLGPTVFCADGKPGEITNLLNTSQLIIDLLQRSRDDLSFQQECRIQAENRLGLDGGGRSISELISVVVEDCMNKN